MFTHTQMRIFWPLPVCLYLFAPKHIAAFVIGHWRKGLRAYAHILCLYVCMCACVVFCHKTLIRNAGMSGTGNKVAFCLSLLLFVAFCIANCLSTAVFNNSFMHPHVLILLHNVMEFYLWWLAHQLLAFEPNHSFIFYKHFPIYWPYVCGMWLISGQVDETLI